jgi:hypothetical protein
MAAFSEISPIPQGGAGETDRPRPHPKSGERRRARQPLRLDRLPLALLDRIRAERVNGRTWDEIERASPQWPEWDQATPEALALFPGRRLPHSNLQRWHDLRVEQVQREREGQAATAQAFARGLAARGTAHLGPAVENALSDSVFRLVLEGGDEQRIRDELRHLAQVIAAVDRNEIARQRLQLGRRKLELAAQQAEVHRLLAENALSLPKLSRFLKSMMDSPAFQPYFEAWAAMQAARDAGAPSPEAGPSSACWAVRDASGSQENLEPDGHPEPDEAPEPEDHPRPPAVSRECAEDAQDAEAPASNHPTAQSLNHPITQSDQPGPEDAAAEGNPPSPTVPRHLPRKPAPPEPVHGGPQGCVVDPGEQAASPLEGKSAEALPPQIAQLPDCPITQLPRWYQVRVEEAKREEENAAALSPGQMYLEVARDVLVRLRNYRLVREALDPLRDQLVAELTDASERFAERIEARLD